MLRLLFECEKCKNRYEIDAGYLSESGTPICTDCDDDDCSCLGYSTDPNLHVWKDLGGDLLEHKSAFASGEAVIEPWYAELKDLEDRNSLITLVYQKCDTYEMVVDENDDGDIYADLTDDEWEEVRRRFDHRKDLICSLIWDTIGGICAEVVSEGDRNKTKGVQ